MKMQRMKFNSKGSTKAASKKLTFGVGGNTVNPSFPNNRRSAMSKSVKAKDNTQTMGFNDSIPSK